MAARRKKIDTWEFLIDSVKVLVPVYMKSDDHGSLFMVKMDEYDYETCSRDINAMRRDVEQELRQRATMTWERFIYVTYYGHDSEPHTYDEQEPDEALDGEFTAEIHLQYEVVEVASRPDGEKMHRYLRQNYNNGRAMNGLPQTGRNRNFHYDHPTMSSLIPFTTENMAALNNIRQRFIQLNRILEQKLLPENVQKTLENVGGGTLNLMAP